MTVRLMLVDDHRMLREGLRRSMEDAGFDVVGEASDGEEAVSLSLEHRPDVVLMDVTMPVLDAVRTVAAGETALSPDIAASMLTEMRRLDAGRGEVVSRREEEVLQLIADG